MSSNQRIFETLRPVLFIVVQAAQSGVRDALFTTVKNLTRDTSTHLIEEVVVAIKTLLSNYLSTDNHSQICILEEGPTTSGDGNHFDQISQ